MPGSRPRGSAQRSSPARTRTDSGLAARTSPPTSTPTVRRPEAPGQPYTATTWSLNTLRDWGLDAAVLGDTAVRLAENSRWDYDDLPYWGGEVDCCINAFTLANGTWLGADVDDSPSGCSSTSSPTVAGTASGSKGPPCRRSTRPSTCSTGCCSTSSCPGIAPARHGAPRRPTPRSRVPARTAAAVPEVRRRARRLPGCTVSRTRRAGSTPRFGRPITCGRPGCRTGPRRTHVLPRRSSSSGRPQRRWHLDPR